jgi:hypothetical protein
MDLPLVGGGALGALVLVILYLLRVNATDRRDYRRDVADCLERVNAEVKSRREIQGLLDDERRARRRAEDTAWIWLREHPPQSKPVDDGPD